MLLASVWILGRFSALNTHFSYSGKASQAGAATDWQQSTAVRKPACNKNNIFSDKSEWHDWEAANLASAFEDRCVGELMQTALARPPLA